MFVDVRPVEKTLLSCGDIKILIRRVCVRFKRRGSPLWVVVSAHSQYCSSKTPSLACSAVSSKTSFELQCLSFLIYCIKSNIYLFCAHARIGGDSLSRLVLCAAEQHICPLQDLDKECGQKRTESTCQ